MLAFRIQVLRVVRSDRGGVLDVGHAHKPNGLASSMSVLPDRESRPRRRRAAGRVAEVFVRAPSPDVVASDEAGLDAVQEWLEVEKAGRDDAETLHGLCARYHGPGVMTLCLDIPGSVPEDELASRGGNGAICRLASKHPMVLTDLRAPKRKKETDRGFSGTRDSNLPDYDNGETYQS